MIVRRRHRPVGNGLLTSIAEREIAEVPVPTGIVFDPAPMDAPVIHFYAALRDVFM